MDCDRGADLGYDIDYRLIHNTRTTQHVDHDIDYTNDTDHDIDYRL